MNSLAKIKEGSVQQVLHVRDINYGTSTLLIQVRGKGWFRDERVHLYRPPTKQQLRDCLKSEGPFHRVEVTEVKL